MRISCKQKFQRQNIERTLFPQLFFFFCVIDACFLQLLAENYFEIILFESNNTPSPPSFPPRPFQRTVIIEMAFDYSREHEHGTNIALVLVRTIKFNWFREKFRHQFPSECECKWYRSLGLIPCSLHIYYLKRWWTR